MFVHHIWKNKLRPDQVSYMETYAVSPALQLYELSSWEQWAD